MKAAHRIAVLAVGTAIGLGVAAVGDLGVSRRSRHAAAEAAAAGLHGAEERRLAQEVSRYLLLRKELDRRIGILTGLGRTPAFREPIAATRRTLAWSARRRIMVKSLLVEGGELRAVIATAEPGAAIGLARDLVSQRLIESPGVRWIDSVDGKDRRWLEVSGRLALPREVGAPTPGDKMERR